MALKLSAVRAARGGGEGSGGLFDNDESQPDVQHQKWKQKQAPFWRYFS
jgi:hypothetical protein